YNLRFNKIYTYSYDLRPQLYTILKKSNFFEEKRLKNHISIKGQTYDVLIHSYFFDDLSFRMGDENDAMLYFKWRNDPEVLSNSYRNDPVKFEEHSKWFISKLSSGNCFLYLFF